MANTFDRQEKALKIISDFADRFCSKIPLEGKGDQLDLSGDAKVEISNLIKLLTDLKIEGSAKYLKNNYEGVLQKDLVEVLTSNVNCRLEIWKGLRESLLVQHNKDVIKGDDTYKFQDMEKNRINSGSTSFSKNGLCEDALTENSDIECLFGRNKE